jgi:hypothetical protein
MLKHNKLLIMVVLTVALTATLAVLPILNENTFAAINKGGAGGKGDLSAKTTKNMAAAAGHGGGGGGGGGAGHGGGGGGAAGGSGS